MKVPDADINAAVGALLAPLTGNPTAWVEGASWPQVQPGQCVVSTRENELRLAPTVGATTGMSTGVRLQAHGRRARVLELSESDYGETCRAEVRQFVERHAIGGPPLPPLGIWISSGAGFKQVVLDVNRTFDVEAGRPNDWAIMFAFLNSQNEIFFMDDDTLGRYWKIPADTEIAIGDVISRAIGDNP